MKFQQLKNIHHQDSKQFFLISGPCIVESEQMCMDIAGKVLEICDEYKIPYIFKNCHKLIAEFRYTYCKDPIFDL